MSKVMLFLFLSLLTQLFSATYNVDGCANLEGETDHSGIKVFFQRVAPDASFSYTVYTNSVGYYSSVVEGGWYDVLYSKSEFISKDTADVALYSNMTLPNVLIEKIEHCMIIEAGTHIISESIEVFNGDTLIIRPGARLELNPGVSINVNGLLIAEGTENDSIVFTGYNGGTWGSVTLNDICDNNSRISYCYFEKSNFRAVQLYSCHIIVSNCTFYNNKGALSISGYIESPIIKDCRFYKNGNQFGWLSGGAIYCAYASPLISNCIIEQNTADKGGGIYNMVAKFNLKNTYFHPIISNCKINNNIAYEEGGGIYMDGMDMTIINSVIANNYSNNYCGGIYTTQDLRIYNSIISGNSGCGIYNNSVITHDIQYTNIYDEIFNKQDYLLVNVTTNSNGDPCDAWYNISMDPKFGFEFGFFYALQSDSPCIDAGTNSISGYTFPEKDLAGSYRIWDGDGNGTMLVDMGAYEYASPSEYFTSMSTPFTPLSYSSNEWGDYDNDGDLDLLITGEAGTAVYCTKLYNNNAGTFTEVSTGMVNISAGSVAWGDYDNDGDVDILLSGYTGSAGVTKIYRNDGSGTFTDINAGLPGCYYNSVSWADYDNDGDLDVLITGYVNSTTRLSEIYCNDGNGVFTDVNAGLINASSSSAAWGDYDNDGDPDILLTGYSSTGVVSKIYRNDNGVFADINAGLTGVLKSSVAWGDYDNDGDLDILLTGMPTFSSYTSKVYRNDGGAVFTDIAAGLVNAGYSSAVWTDYNCDGYLDILLSGGNETTVLTKMYQNDLDGTFNETTHYFEPVKFSSVTACDYDNDGRSDYLISGSNGTERVTKLYKSNMPAANTKPAAPASLSSVLNGSETTLSWNKATDAQTPQNGLSYNLYIGTSPLTGNKKSPMSNISNGYRKVIKLGNVGQNTTWTIKDIEPGTYYWSVQAVDNAYAGSLFGEEKTFTVDLSVPSNVNVVYAAGNVTLSWAVVPGAVSYKVYSSEEPYGTFADVSSQGTLTGTSWSQAVAGNKLFYYVVAVTAKVENINQSVKVEK